MRGNGAPGRSARRHHGDDLHDVEDVDGAFKQATDAGATPTPPGRGHPLGRPLRLVHRPHTGMRGRSRPIEDLRRRRFASAARRRWLRWPPPRRTSALEEPGGALRGAPASMLRRRRAYTDRRVRVLLRPATRPCAECAALRRRPSQDAKRARWSTGSTTGCSNRRDRPSTPIRTPRSVPADGRFPVLARRAQPLGERGTRARPWSRARNGGRRERSTTLQIEGIL